MWISEISFIGLGSFSQGMTTSYDPELPFFSYGIFQPGQLGYFRIREYVDQIQEGTIQGRLWVRDGIPLLDQLERDTVEGSIIWFSSDTPSKAYEEIRGVEPESQYSWDTATVTTENDESYNVNVLVGKNPEEGGNFLVDLHGDELSSWNGRRDDPLFNEALEVIEETREQYGDFEPGKVKPFFHLQMAYLLLWVSLERYASLRYGFQLPPRGKRDALADEEAFADGLEEVVSTRRRNARSIVHRADDPDRSEELDPEDPRDSVEYYYSVRNNIVHRGKGALDNDFNLMHDCLQELYEIYDSYVLPAAFEEP